MICFFKLYIANIHFLGIHWSWLATPSIASQFADTQTVVLYDANLQDYIAFGRRDDNNGRDDVCPGNYQSYRNIVRSTSSTNICNLLYVCTFLLTWQ